MLRDYDEIVINYILKNSKTVVILAGSIIETLLIYYCEKKKINEIEISRGKKILVKKIYETQLNELLIFANEMKLFPKHVYYLGNVARIYRNYIHPGKELKDGYSLDFGKAEICFSSLQELINEIVR